MSTTEDLISAAKAHSGAEEPITAGRFGTTWFVTWIRDGVFIRGEGPTPDEAFADAVGKERE